MKPRARYARMLALLLAAAALPAGAAEPIAADVPVARTDANSLRVHEDLLAKRHKGRIDVYFVGDSITRRWGAAEPLYRALLDHWKASFFGWNAANFAWGGDTTNNILWRLEAGELTGVNPKVIVLMAGTNNLNVPALARGEEAMAADIARGLQAIVRRCRELAPGARIVVMGITPRNDEMRYMPVIRRVNARLAALADGTRIRFIDLDSKLAQPDGTLRPGMTDPDRLHLALPAYEIWAQALRPVLTEWLGPPAATDSAPPPTGNPEAMGRG